MDYTALKTEIETGPLATECAGGTDEGITDILNRQDISAIQERWVTTRTVLAELGATAGAAILDKLQAASASSSPVRWMMTFLAQDSGIDIGNVQTQASIDGLITAGVLTSAEGASLKNMALKTCSRAQIAGFGTVTPGDVSRALRGPW